MHINGQNSKTEEVLKLVRHLIDVKYEVEVSLSGKLKITLERSLKNHAFISHNISFIAIRATLLENN